MRCCHEDSPLPADEIKALLDLIPKRKPPAPRLTRVFQPMLDVLSPKWVRDFLFTPYPIHIQHLSSSSVPHTAFLCYAESAGVERNGTRHSVRQNIVYSNRGYILYVPSFCANSTTVGVGVWHSVSKGLPITTKTKELVKCNIRFAMDSRTKTLLLLLDDRKENTFYMYTSRLLSSTKSRTMSARFHSSIQDLMLAEDCELSLQKVLPYLLFAQDEVQDNICSICGKHPSHVQCNCEIPSFSPMHPYDTSCFTRAMMHHTVVSKALGSRMIFADGKPRHYSILGAYSAMQAVQDVTLIRNMCEWSISEHTSSVQVDPLQSLLFRQLGAEEEVTVDSNNERRGVKPNLSPGRRARIAITNAESIFSPVTTSGDEPQIPDLFSDLLERTAEPDSSGAEETKFFQEGNPNPNPSRRTEFISDLECDLHSHFSVQKLPSAGVPVRLGPICGRVTKLSRREASLRKAVHSKNEFLNIGRST